jgi:hypothetical protein
MCKEAFGIAFSPTAYQRGALIGSHAEKIHGAVRLRWRLPGRGKSGGARVLHLYLKHREATWLLDIQAKSEKANLSPGDLRAARAVAGAIKAAAG